MFDRKDLSKQLCEVAQIAEVHFVKTFGTERIAAVRQAASALLRPESPAPIAGGAAPDGWQLVPKEPPAELLVASRTRHGQDYVTPQQWRAMLSASPSPPSGWQGIVADARRYRRLQILGCAPFGWHGLATANVLRFTGLDEFVDADLKWNPSRGESLPLSASPSPPSSGRVTEEQIVRHFQDTFGHCGWLTQRDAARAVLALLQIPTASATERKT